MPIKRKRRKDRDAEKTLSHAQFVTTLRRLADALEAGQPFVIQVSGERLTVPAGATVSIEHEREGGDDELEFQLKWRREKRKR